MDAADDRLQIFPAAHADRAKIRFVEEDNPLPVARTIQKLFGVGAERLRPVDDDQRNAGRLERALGALDARRFKSIGMRPNSGRVDESNRYAFDDKGLLNRVARRAGNLGDDCAFAVEESVEERRLPGIWGTDDCDAYAFAH